jgi:hypothetical protein
VVATHAKVGLVLATILLSALAACASRPPQTSPPVARGATSKITDHLHLDQTRVVAGKSVNGDLIVYNPGSTIKLSKGCTPQLFVELNRGSFHQAVPVATACEAGPPLTVRQGTTMFTVSVDTTYNICSQSPPYSVTLPRCLGSDPPPLPVGTYMAKAFWAGTVPLPAPKEVALTLVG